MTVSYCSVVAGKEHDVQRDARVLQHRHQREGYHRREAQPQRSTAEEQCRQLQVHILVGSVTSL